MGKYGEREGANIARIAILSFLVGRNDTDRLISDIPMPRPRVTISYPYGNPSKAELLPAMDSSQTDGLAQARDAPLRRIVASATSPLKRGSAPKK